MSLDLNFAEKPFRNYTLFYTVFAVFAAAVFVLTLYNVITYFNNSKEYNEYAHLIQRGNERIQAATKETTDLKDALRTENRKDLLEYVNFVNDSIRLRTFSWTDFFNELEQQLPPGVKLFYIKPKGREAGIEILLKFTSKNVREALDFFDNLDRCPAFESAFPRREARNQTKRNYYDWQISLRYLPEKAGLPAVEEEIETAGMETGEEIITFEDAGFILETNRLSVTGLPFLPGEETSVPLAGSPADGEDPLVDASEEPLMATQEVQAEMSSETDEVDPLETEEEPFRELD